MIPLYGFLEGDTLGLLILAQETDSIREVAHKMQSAAKVRVAPKANPRVFYNGRELDPESIVGNLGFRPLERLDVTG